MKQFKGILGLQIISVCPPMQIRSIKLLKKRKHPAVYRQLTGGKS